MAKHHQIGPRPMTSAEKQARYWNRLKRENYRAVDDETLLAEAARRGLIPTDQPDTGAHATQEDAR